MVECLHKAPGSISSTTTAEAAIIIIIIIGDKRNITLETTEIITWKISQ